MRSRRGQLSIPALFALPCLFLFVYLIFETAKLSREKIRHQFAVDAAAFIEMTNYSDFLNRSAYVNGAFPQRIFYEGFNTTMIDRKNNTAPDRLYDILFKNGTFPRMDGVSGDTALDSFPTWKLRFGGCGTGKNDNPPDMMSCAVASSGGGRLDLLTLQNALDYWLSWDDAQDIYKLYVQIYQLLGSVEDAQTSVFKRLTGNHNFFRKSYWLNTGDPIGSADAGASYFNAYQFQPKPYCVQEIMFYGNKPTSDPFQPYKQWGPNKPIVMPSTIANCQPNAGLFQAEAIPDDHLKNMKTVHAPLANYPGYPVIQRWSAPSNYFRVDFNNLVKCQTGGVSSPCVHSTIMLSGGRLWPDPTPKFQTRLYP